MTLQERLEQLLTAYSYYFDIERDVTVEGGSFPATAFYHFREENYIATKAHGIYATEQHEYVYFYMTEHLDADDLRRSDDTIRLHFELLDRLGVPFWVQNSAIAWASDWRNTRRQSIRSAMAARNIIMQ